jgi:hypothetical protein
VGRVWLDMKLSCSEHIGSVKYIMEQGGKRTEYEAEAGRQKSSTR